MSLAPGSRLGPFEILAPLGRGGMGEVYKARDRRLDRTVAIKVLPDRIASDPISRERFEREARTISRLNHPHICALYDVGREPVVHPGGERAGAEVDFLVLELIEGETVANRLARSGTAASPFSLADVLTIGIQICDALDAAHRQGIVHRDLKPANVMIAGSAARRSDRYSPQRGARPTVKLLDFGLAKLHEAEGGGGDTTTNGAAPLTSARAIVGTLAYMAPEQLHGGVVDHRTDIFALGATLFEMATGRRAFDGRGDAATMAAILASAPPKLRSLVASVPSVLEEVVDRCLAGDPADRWQSAADIRHVLEWVRDTRPDAPAKVRHRRNKWIPLVAAGIAGAIVSAAAAALLRPRAAPPDAPLAYFTLPLGDGFSLHEYCSDSVAMSPDGRLVAYAANGRGGRHIYVRSLDSPEPRRIEGTENGISPFFSPDGRWLGFAAGGTLKRVNLDGGSAVKLAEVPYFAGASWMSNGDLIFVPTFTGGLRRLAAGAGGPVRLPVAGEQHRSSGAIWPEVLPDDDTVLFTIWQGGSLDEATIAVQSIRTGERQVVLKGGFHARYVSSGHIVYLRGNVLMAAPFDLSGRRITGPAVAVQRGVAAETANGSALFGLSRSGTLAFGPGSAHAVSRRLVWIGTDGIAKRISADARAFGSPRLSPDGRRLAVWIEEATASLWAYELERDTLTRVSFGEDDHSPAWSPDGSRLAFESGRGGVHHIYTVRVDGTGANDQLTRGDYEHYVSDWSHDGSLIAYTEFHSGSAADIWLVSPDRSTPPRPWLVTPASEKQAVFSPDSRWIAYVSDESGRNEVFVRPLDGSDARVQISNGGGEEPGWPAPGATLYYRNGGRMMAVPVSTTPILRAGRPEVRFEGSYHFNIAPNRTYDVAPDGRFIMLTETDATTSPRQIDVLLNWAGHLRARVRPSH